MIGLVYLAVFVVYLLVALWLINVAVRFARVRGIAGWKFGVPMAIVMYLLVFWDHIPTMLVHDYECRNKAGLVVFKTPEQWKAENLADSSRVRPYIGYANFQRPDGTHGYWLNDRFTYELTPHALSVFPVTKVVEAIVDSKTKTVLVHRTSIDSGYGSLAIGHDWHALKVWVGKEACTPDSDRIAALLQAYRDIGSDNTMTPLPTRVSKLGCFGGRKLRQV